LGSGLVPGSACAVATPAFQRRLPVAWTRSISFLISQYGYAARISDRPRHPSPSRSLTYQTRALRLICGGSGCPEYRFCVT
jgi:hypothetical protein